MSSEDERLMSTNMRKEDSRHKPDWSRFGLSSEQREEAERQRLEGEEENYDQHGEVGQHNELFTQDQSAKSKPWWKSNFFVVEPVLFGTWDGVFTSCMINIFGVVIFLRTGWMVGNAGIGYSMLVLLLTVALALISVLSAIGLCERCRMERGGVYFLLSHVLGARVGAAFGILYCFGQAVACSLYTVGFGESIAGLIHQENPWVAKGIALGVTVLLLSINIAGVKWVIRLQLLLLMILFIAVLDFLVGSFVHTDPAHGFIGYDLPTLQNNTGPSYQEGESFFTVFGVFFPTATGVFAGINMSGDLRNPSKNIPIGTLSAVGVSTGLYLSFATVLGATCVRDALQNDYLIAEKVSIVGVLFLAGLYISSISSCMGGLYGSPRILQTIAEENVIPVIKVLGQGRGPNKVPVYALIVITLISILFVFLGDVNTLGPIVTMPFMLSYAAVDYAYFALAMSADKRRDRERRFESSSPMHKQNGGVLSPDSQSHPQQSMGYGSMDPKAKTSNDLDNLFPERHHDPTRPQRPPQPQEGGTGGGGAAGARGQLGSPTFVQQTDDELLDPGRGDAVSMASEADDTAGLLNKPPPTAHQKSTEITSQPRSFYSILSNRWVSLLGALCSLIITFGIQWGYALANIGIVIVIYIYIGQFNPGTFPGIAEFSMWQWIRDGFRRCCRRGPPPPEQVIVQPNTPAMNTMAAQLTEDNEDFADRGRYHQSEVVKGDNFDDNYDSD